MPTIGGVTVLEQLAGHLASSGTPSKRRDVTLGWISDSDDGPASWSELGQLDWSRFRLVLGAGGTTGAAFTAGVLLALANGHRVSLRNASHLVGTSSGSVLAALITMGLESDDLAAVVGRTPQWLSPTFGSYDFSVGDDVPPAPRLRKLVRPMGPRDIARSASLARARRYRALWLHCVRPGTFDLTHQLPFISNMAWSVNPRLSVCCTDSSTGDRVVYERDSGVKLADALAASCAVPGVMRPVTIDDQVLVDGGVVSPTNADLALDTADTTTTVVVSPMSGTGSRSAIGRASSRFASSRLLGEIRRGHPTRNVLVIEPAARLGALVADDALNYTRTNQILATSFVSASGARIIHRRR
jgi:NTE family protein